MHAYQLQLKYNETEDSTVPLKDNETEGSEKSPDAPTAAHDARFACIFTGAAGTGKTALLEACDMLTQAVYKSSECVYRSAPSRTAARLNRGNTCHSAWKLPFGCSLGEEGRLSNETLERLRKMLRGVHEASIDEISMLGPQKFYQIDARARSGSNKHHLFMGGYKLRLSGDFLQLPPVKSGSFAGPAEDDPSERAGTAKAKEKDYQEHFPTALGTQAARNFEKLVKEANQDFKDEQEGARIRKEAAAAELRSTIPEAKHRYPQAAQGMKNIAKDLTKEHYHAQVGAVEKMTGYLMAKCKKPRGAAAKGHAARVATLLGYIELLQGNRAPPNHAEQMSILLPTFPNQIGRAHV